MITPSALAIEMRSDECSHEVLESLPCEAQRRLGFEPLGDVAVGRHNAVDPGLVEEVRDHALDDPPRAVLVSDPILDGRFGAARHELLGDRLLDPRHVVRMDQVTGLGANQLIGPVAEHPFHRGTRVDRSCRAASAIVRTSDACCTTARNRRSLSPQLLFDLHPVRDVPRVQDHAVDRLVVDEVGADRLQTAPRPISGLDPQHDRVVRAPDPIDHLLGTPRSAGSRSSGCTQREDPRLGLESPRGSPTPEFPPDSTNATAHPAPAPS